MLLYQICRYIGSDIFWHQNDFFSVSLFLIYLSYRNSEREKIIVENNSTRGTLSRRSEFRRRPRKTSSHSSKPSPCSKCILTFPWLAKISSIFCLLSCIWILASMLKARRYESVYDMTKGSGRGGSNYRFLQ